ncbi:hypothetical protein PVK06_028408 [Gossypium arboreum]|uniref:RNase H type-1 domain-containing protein n=1 Tax=Gossypium arboreum TaxID=29729 RepID=A0ABR0P3B5_GOSAR|nr:hypothetical protein PVK06_028408 [Gossypium arboreum]
MGARRITLEIDSLVVVRLINGQIRSDGSNAILRDIWKLLHRDWLLRASHVHGQGKGRQTKWLH